MLCKERSELSPSLSLEWKRSVDSHTTDDMLYIEHKFSSLARDVFIFTVRRELWTLLKCKGYANA